MAEPHPRNEPILRLSQKLDASPLNEPHPLNELLETLLETRLETLLETRLQKRLETLLETLSETLLQTRLETFLETLIETRLEKCLETCLEKCFETFLEKAAGADPSGRPVRHRSFVSIALKVVLRGCPTDKIWLYQFQQKSRCRVSSSQLNS